MCRCRNGFCRLSLAVVVCGLFMAGSGSRLSAQPAGVEGVETLVPEIDRLRSKARDPAVPPSERGLLREQLRAALLRAIETAPDDDRAATWMLDAATEILDELSQRSDEAAVLLGIPTPEQTERARESAARAEDLVRRARDAARRAVSQLEARLFQSAEAGRGEDAAREAAAVEQLLAVLIDRELLWRMALLEGRSSLLRAAADVRSGRDRAPGELRGPANLLESIAVPDRTMEGKRHVLLGAALLGLARVDETARLRARIEFEAVDGDSAAAPLDRLMARMGLAQCATVSEDLPRQRAVERLLNVATDPQIVSLGPAASLLAAEGATAALVASTPPPTSNPSERRLWLEQSLSPLASLLSQTPTGIDTGAWRSVVLRKLGVAAGESRRPEELPSAAAFGQAVLLLSKVHSDERDRSRSEAAAGTLLEVVLTRPDAGELRADALWELGLLRVRSTRPAERLEGSRLLARLAREFPRRENADNAIRGSVDAARGALASVADGDRAPYTEGLRKALEVAVELHTSANESPEWCLELARLLIEQPAEGPEAARLERILQLLNSRGVVAAGQAAEVNALAESAIRAGMARVATQDAKPSADELAVAELATGWARGRVSPGATELLLAGAESILRAGDPRAVDLLRVVKSRAPDVLAARASLGLGRSLRMIGQPDAAFATLRSLATDLDKQSAPPRSPDDPARPIEFWAAWAEMLEILSQSNSGGSRTGSIRLHLNRLALIDPQLGPEPFRSRIVGVRDSLGAVDKPAPSPPPGG